MPRKNDLLEHVRVPKPCEADWDSMKGNEQARFCSHCELHVHDLSHMTRAEALKLVSRSQGRLCVRYVPDPRGGVRTLEAASAPLYRITRRASRIAAGAFTAAISLTANAAARTHAHGEASARAEVAAFALQQQRAAVRGGAISGTVTDPADAVIAGATVVATNTQTGAEQTIRTNGEGVYSFQNLIPGTYNVRVIAEHFNPHFFENVVVNAGAELNADARLDVGGAVQGVIMVMEATEPLVKAASFNDLVGVEKLLAGGADPNVLDKGIDSTALAQAVSHNNIKLIERLLTAGADVNFEDRAGRTALMELNDKATPEVVRALLEAGAQVNMKDDEGNTALAHAITSCSADVIRKLIEAGAKLDARNDEGKTALMLAAGEGSLEAVKVLLAAGAGVNLKDDENETALDHANEGGHEEVAAYLVSHGAVEGGDDDDAEEEEEEEKEEP